MKKVDVLLGLQWGDEGKGKIVDVLTPEYDVIARFQGGPNAGHTLEFEGIKHVLHTIPSGIFRENAVNVVGNGVVIDPIIFKKEIDALDKRGVDATQRLKISKKAHLILPSHRLLDAASEAAKGKGKIGSTLKGIGPTYMDKTGRNGIRVGDILSANFKEKYTFLKEKHEQMLGHYGAEGVPTDTENEWFASLDTLKRFELIDSEPYLNDKLKNNQTILAEGAQGSLLDIDFGSYPFVTSSNTVCAGACTGLGIAPNRIGRVIGIFKAYCTRVGSGPFPTELFDEIGETLCEIGHEYGSTTGRKRRCGWLDIPALNYAIMINGVTELNMMKTDVLDTFDTIKVCTGYKVNGELTDQMPFDLTEEVEPVYTELKGWKTDLTKFTNGDALPSELKEYIAFIEKQTGVPISVVSVGPDREQTLFQDVKTVETA
ncbi:MAG: adenylosuccinate synthase [Flavobacteriales bacterium]|nr:adenylosuccinate synthase [Flavobacteriales bacterium]MCB9192066.1 adenylosuccinate synthase [Flavobacteriales bacterium]